MKTPSSLLRRLCVALVAITLTACAPTATTEKPVPKFTWGETPGAPSLPATPVPTEVTLAHLTACPSSGPAKVVDGGLPDLTLDCYGGKSKVNLAGLDNGRPKIITIWAQWCGPCEAETPYLVAAHDHLGDKVDFIGINMTDPFPDKVLAFASRYGMNWPQLVDPKGASRAGLRANAIPMTVLVQADGTIVHRTVSPFASTDEVERTIAEHLGVTA